MKLTKQPLYLIDHTYEIEIEPQERIVISFAPAGVNRVIGSKRIKLVLETMFLGNGRVALVVKMNDNVYQNRAEEFYGDEVGFCRALFLLEDENEADVLEFPDKLLKLVKIKEDLT